MKLHTNKIKPLDFLLNKTQENHHDFEQLPKCAFLLGAGCSRSSNIPTGGEVINILRKLWFLAHTPNGNKYKIDSFTINEDLFKELQDSFQTAYLEKETDLLSSIKERINDYEFHNYLSEINEELSEEKLSENLFNDELYGFWFEAFSENPKERQKLIESLVDSGEPSGAYILFAHLIANNKISNVFTTNFDDLVNDCLIRYTDIKPRVYSHNEIANYINPLSARPNIIKLHGDFLFENIKNTQNETTALWSNMDKKLEESLKNFDLIVSGYNGADNSVMSVLANLKEKYPFGIYWCGSNPDNLNWRVKAFINHYPNSYFIQVDTFELFVYKLFNCYINQIDFPELIDSAKRKQDEFNNYLNEFKSDLISQEELDSEQKQEIERSFEIILDRNSFFRFNELKSDDEKTQYLRKLRLDGISRILKNIHTHISWENAKFLYEQIDKDDFFIEKVKEVPIQHISNAFSNLKKIDKDRTFNIINKIPDNVLTAKLENAKDSDIYSAIYELTSIHPDKINAIKKQRDLKIDDEQLSQLDLRRIIFKLKTVSSSSARELVINEEELLIQKLTNEDFKEATLFFENLFEILPKEAQGLFVALDIELLIKKIENQNFNQIGKSISLFTKLDRSKAFNICEQLDYSKVLDKAKPMDLASIQNAFREINESNKFLATRLFKRVNDDFLIEKIKSTDLITIGEAVSNLSSIDFKRVRSLIQKIDDDFFIRLLNKSELTYQHFGNTFNKLTYIEFHRFCHIVRNADSEKLSMMISSTMNKTGEQVFLHFVPIVFKLDKHLFASIISKCSQEYIDSILKWEKIELYTVNLPYLKRVFELNHMDKEVEYLKYIIDNNQKRFEKRKKRKSTKHNTRS